MARIDNWATTKNWAYTPAFKTIQISTKRHPAMSGGKVSAAVTNLTGVESSPLILPSQQSQFTLRKALGDIVGDATALQVWEMHLHKCAHVDSGSNVDQLPDIQIGDKVTVDNVDYEVRWADITHPFSFGDVLILTLTEDKI